MNDASIYSPAWDVYVERSPNNIQLFHPYLPFPLQLDTLIDDRRMNRCSRPKLTIETSSNSKPSPESMPSSGDDSISPPIICIHYESQILLLTMPQILL